MSDWESLCRRCGRCCFEKLVDADGRIHPTRIPCCHLDVATRECRVYEKRLEVGEGCIRLTPEVVAAIAWLPEDCAYVQHVHGLTREPERRRRRRGKSR